MRLILYLIFTALCAFAPASASALRVLLYDPSSGHGDARSHLHSALFGLADDELAVRTDFLSKENLDATDVVVLSGATAEALPEGDRERIKRFVDQGGGLVSVHPASPGERHFARSKAIVRADGTANADPSLRTFFEGLPSEAVLTERWLKGRAAPGPNDAVLLRAGAARHGVAVREEQPVAWARREGEGRMVTSLLGKENIYTQADGYGRALLRNAVRYASGRVDGSLGKPASLTVGNADYVRLLAANGSFNLSLATPGVHRLYVRDSRGRLLFTRRLHGPTQFHSPSQRGLIHVRVDGPEGTVTRWLALP